MNLIKGIELAVVLSGKCDISKDGALLQSTDEENFHLHQRPDVKVLVKKPSFHFPGLFIFPSYMLLNMSSIETDFVHFHTFADVI